MKKTLIMGAILLASLTTLSVIAQEKKELKEPKKITSVEGITEYRLENGLGVLLFPDPSKQTITVNVTYRVGSKHENYGETGMAHLLEHLVFKGTPNHKDIPKELTEHGARPNGTTWLDRTNYFETFKATEENLKWALDLESDRMVNSFIAAADLESEMTVVRNEFESGENSPVGVMLKRVQSAAYSWHNYGNSTIGARSDIENVPIDRLQAFYRKYYQPDNAVLTVAGNFDEAATLKLVNEYFGKIPRPERVLPKIYTKDPVQDGERSVNIRRVGDIQYVGAAYHLAPGSHPDFAALDVMSEILTDEPSGRLYKALVDSKKATNVFGLNFQLEEPGLALFLTEVRKDGDLEDAGVTLTETIESFAKNPPTKEEVERAKTALIKNIELALNSSERVGLTLSEWIAMGDWRLYFLHRDRLKKVTADDVTRVAKNYLKRSNRTTGKFLPTESPDRAEIPDVPNIQEMLKDYKGGEAVAQGEDFDPSPSNIESRTNYDKGANGMEMAFLPKKTRGEKVTVNLNMRFGNLEGLKNKGTIASFTNAMLNKGTSDMSRQEVKDAFDKLKAQVSIGGGVSQASVRIETVRENLSEVMTLLAKVLKDPVFPQDELDKLKEERLAGIENQSQQPQAIAINEAQRLVSNYPKDDPRYVKTFDEQIEAINSVKVEEIKQFYKDFYGASNTQLSVVGDFDEAEIKALSQKLLGDWQSASKFKRLTSKYYSAPAQDKKIETPDKANAFFIAFLKVPVGQNEADYPALTLGNFILGGGFLNSRLATRIRQKEGISYGVGSFYQGNSIDAEGTFGAFAIYAPENLERLEKAFSEEIQKAIEEGFSDEEIEAAKSGWIQSRSVARSQDRTLAGMMNSNLYLDRKMTWEAELEEKVKALSAKDILKAMQKHIQPDKIVYVKAGDFKGAAERMQKESTEPGGAGSEEGGKK